MHDVAHAQRVLFDFWIEFSNGGALQGQGFRPDIVARRRGRQSASSLRSNAMAAAGLRSFALPMK
jgi:hypothetical protein